MYANISRVYIRKPKCCGSFKVVNCLESGCVILFSTTKI